MGGRRRVGQPDDWMCPAKVVGSPDRQIRRDIILRAEWELPLAGGEVTDPILPRKASRENQGARTANRRW